MVEKKDILKGKTVSYPNRLLRALASIYEDSDATADQRLQAIKLSLDVLPHRLSPRRKTEKERLVIKALQSAKKAGDKPQPSLDGKTF